MDKQEEIGYCLSSKNYLTYLDGLPSIRINDLVESDSGHKGLVYSLADTSVEVLMLQEGPIIPGQVFKKTGQRLSLTVGDFLLGRAVNPLGIAIDGKGMLSASVKSESVEMEKEARGIESREFINNQFITGVTLIDNLIPLGKGQRELIIGDSHSGVSNFLTNLIVNQKSTGMVCVYGVIGKPVTYIRNLINTLAANKALDHSVIVASSSTEPTPLIYLTPMAALTVAEYFQMQGKDVLLILDDMGIHAKIYREIALLGGRSPGRESYPADSFYQHAKLLERAGRFNVSAGNGSITALPVIELNLSDFTGFITTNLMSITDGHLLFKASSYNKNQRPAVDLSLSVTRVGRQTQPLINNLLSKKIRQVMAAAENLETLSRFSAELPEETQLILRQKEIIEEAIRQEDLTLIPLPLQTVLLGLVFSTFLKDRNSEFLRKYKIKILQSFATDPNLLKITQITSSLKSDDEFIKLLDGTAPRLKELCP